MPPHRHARSRTRRALVRLACLSFLASGGAAAVESIELRVGEISGPAWRIPEIRAELRPGPDGLRFSLTVPRVELAGEGESPVSRLSLDCDDLVMDDSHVVCRQGRAAAWPRDSETPLESRASFVYRRGDGAWRATGRMQQPGGALDWSLASRGAGINGEISARSFDLSALGPPLPYVPPSIASIGGRIDEATVRFELPEQGASAFRADVTGSGLGFDTRDGRTAAAGVSVALQASGELRDGGWSLDGGATVGAGEFLAGPVYTRVGESPVSLEFRVNGSGSGIEVEQLSLDDPGALSLSASGRWAYAAEAPLRELSVEGLDVTFPAFFDRYLQSVLAQYGFGGLSVTGGLSGSLGWKEGALASFRLQPSHMDVSDEQGRVELENLDGDIRWQASGDPLQSRLNWSSARLYRIPLGSVDLRVSAAGDSLALERQTVVPVLDGALVMNELRVSEWLAEDAELLFDARVMPVSLGRLSEVLGWPEMAGTLSGRIPALTYDDGVYRLGGLLEVEAFDGSLLVENLRLERPFGVLPKLVADVELHQLDLQQLTGTFSFGEIRGRLGGYIRNLRLLDWEPVHFEAEFRTPQDDDSEHRISQRAVDTLTSIGGGGASGALSRSFLRFFDEFAYRRIGLSCRLDGNVCQMGGVSPSPGGGYYIVEGSGLPRVDVIGHVKRVDWPRLVNQLIQATRGNTPVVGDKPDT